MNSKKHKNKNRAKVNPTPVQKQDIAEIAKIEDILPVKDPEPEVNNEEIVPVKGEVKKTLDTSNEENLQELKESLTESLIGDSPVKPKRLKGKKKKHNVTLESDQDNKVDNKQEDKVSQNVQEISEINLPDNTTQELSDVQPCARKKKNKTKRQTPTTNEDIIESKFDAEARINMDDTEEKRKDTAEAEGNVSKKKNKKKKRRLDSEKSDKVEEQMSCTAAFKELVDAQNDKNVLIDAIEDVKEHAIENAENIEITSKVEDFSEQDVAKSEDFKVQKKKKKEKKYPLKAKEDSNYSENKVDQKGAESCDVIQPTMTVRKQDSTKGDEVPNKLFEQTGHITEKPLQGVVAAEIGPKDILERTESMCENLEVSNKLVKTSDDSSLVPKDSMQNLNATPLLSETGRLNEIPVHDISKEKNIYSTSSSKTEENVVINEKDKESANILVNVEEMSEKDQLNATEHSTKLASLSGPPDKAQIPKSVTDDFSQQDKKNDDTLQEEISEGKTEESIDTKEFCDHTPDFIHIPRSSSHQLLDDNNNNTRIQEITGNDELKLGIPVLTSSIIQGSGETPVSTPKVMATGISVTEIESIPNRNQEKTDLKSKMMEVNQDLEELKMSLEKSLAGLNVLEKSEQSFNENRSGENNVTKTGDASKTTNNSKDGGKIYKPLADRLNEIENKFAPTDLKLSEDTFEHQPNTEQFSASSDIETPPVCPSRKDRKGKSKAKKRGRREPEPYTTQATSVSCETKQESNTEKQQETEQKTKDCEGKDKKQACSDNENTKQLSSELQFEPIENFEDALSSSPDDVDINKTFEIIAKELDKRPQNDQNLKDSVHVYPSEIEINITPPAEDGEKEKEDKNVNHASQPKNLLGRPNIPVSSMHLKDQKHIYADAKNISGQNYRLIRMQMILSCEKMLKRKLWPWEQEALLYPRMCADVRCREWKQSKLTDCEGCGQVSFCNEHPDHLPLSHHRWCKSYALYQKLVLYQQSNGRLEPKLPRMVMVGSFVVPDKINEVLATMYEEKIDMSDIQYAALTQVATAPLTTAYCYQIYRQLVSCTNGLCKKPTFTVHFVGAELQFEADSLNKWEVFLLHIKPEVKDLHVALIGVDLNPSNLPLHLLGKIKLCDNCRESKRRVHFSFQDKMTYRDFWASDEFTVPDIVCAFNAGVHRSLMYHGSDVWSSTINCVLKQKVPFLITAYTLEELMRDLECAKSYAEVDYKLISEPRLNPFASVRPDRNFITDEETPLIFKNYCFSVLCGI
ncbi:unnamed protein product, partial [Iphiclides podalirius]